MSVARGSAVVFEASVELVSVVTPSLTTVSVAVMNRVYTGPFLRALVIFGAANDKFACKQRLPPGVIKFRHGGFAPQHDGHTVPAGRKRTGRGNAG